MADKTNPNYDAALGAAGDALAKNDHDFLQARRARVLRELLQSGTIPSGGLAHREVNLFLGDVASYIRESREAIAQESFDVEDVNAFFDAAFELPSAEAPPPKLLQPELPKLKEQTQKNGNGNGHFLASPIG